LNIAQHLGQHLRLFGRHLLRHILHRRRVALSKKSGKKLVEDGQARSPP
jgi:hypothetical protein